MPTISSKPKVAVLALHIQDHDEFQEFNDNFTLVPYKLTDRQTFLEDVAANGKLDGIVAIFADWPGFTKLGGMDKELVNKLPVSLKLIVVPSVGYDHYDVAALKQKGVVLCNTPSISSPAVAETALLLTLSVYKFSSAFERAVRMCGNAFKSKSMVENISKYDARLDVNADDTKHCIPKSEFEPDFTFGSRFASRYPVSSPFGQRVGIAGFGCIGQLIGQRLHSIGMNVHYFKRSQLSAAESKQLGYSATYHSTFESLLKESDLLMLVLPGNKDTHHILNSQTLRLLPEGAKVVNVGRGSLIKESDLLDSLRTGHISSVGLDVYEDEVNINPELLSRNDVTMVPHIGACTADVYNRSVSNCMRNIAAFFESGTAPNQV